MSLKCGIIGLPNIGKSTLFNALTQSSKAKAEMANYPFCTIEPNFGKVNLYDEKLFNLANLVDAEKISTASIEFVDIAGLVEGASKGEGLGNKFLSNIKSVDAIIHLVKCFSNEGYNTSFDPLKEIDIIETELLLSDLNFVEQLLQKKKSDLNKEELKKLHEHLAEGKELRELGNINLANKKEFLTNKKIIYVLNISEKNLESLNKQTIETYNYLKNKNHPVIKLSARIEYELSEIKDIKEREEFMKELGIKSNALENLVKSAYKILDLSSFYTVGKKETKAWNYKNGINAQKAAALIHSDIEKNFIKVEVITYQDYMKYKSETSLKEKGKIRIEGKDYIIKPGDILHFRFNK
ncbi:MAG: redox-regulated ATPase YchF [Rickettsia sp.]|nr:redox-regulated ATPase YchF [Rickettsia sp.]